MDLSKATDEEKLKLSRKYFYGGFFLLPFLWLVLSVWFFKEAFVKKNSSATIRRYVGGAMIGVLVWTTALVMWTCVYQTQRPHWGAFGDYISLIAPVGRP